MDMKTFALLKAHLAKSGANGVLVDSTLTKAGQAADALATGEKIAELSTRIDRIVINSDKECIKTIQIDGEELPVEDNMAEIPIATSDQMGVVRSSSDANKITVLQDGTMEIASISFDKIAQGDEENEVVIGGGGSNF